MMQTLKLTFADFGGENTSYAGELLLSKGAKLLSGIACPAKKNSKSSDFAFELAKSADVILDSGNLDWEGLCKINPHLILCSITGFGLTGPNKDLKSDNYIASASGGSMNMCGFEGDTPLILPGKQAIKSAGLYAVNAIMLTLINLQNEGRGRHIDISLQESVLGNLDSVLVRKFYYNENPVRQGNLTWNHQCFIAPCRNGHILIQIRPSDWESVRDLLVADECGQDLASDAYLDAGYRYKNAEHISEVISGWTKGFDKEDLFETAQLMRMPWVLVKERSEFV